MQFSLACVYLGGLFIFFYHEWMHWTTPDLTEEVMGFKRPNLIIDGMLVVNFSVLALFVLVRAYLSEPRDCHLAVASAFSCGGCRGVPSRGGLSDDSIVPHGGECACTAHDGDRSPSTRASS